MTRSTRRLGRVSLTAAVALGLASAVLVPLTQGALAADPPATSAALAAPTGLSPDDSQLASGTPREVRRTVTLSWQPVAGAASYKVQVGVDDSWADETLTYFDTTVTTSLTLPVLLNPATYVWRVAAVGASGAGAWSSGAEFTRGWRDAPTPLSPMAGQAFHGRPTFRWTPVSGASEYELQVSDNPQRFAPGGGLGPDTSPAPGSEAQGSAGSTTCFTTRTRFTPHTLVTGGEGGPGACVYPGEFNTKTIYWRVRALDQAATTETGPSTTTPVVTSGISYSGPGSSDVTSDCLGQAPAAATPSATASGTPRPSGSAAPTTAPSATPSATPNAGEEGSASCGRPANPVASSAWSAVTTYTPVLAVGSGTFTGAPVATLPLAGSGSADSDNLCVDVPDGGQADHAVCADAPTIRWNAAPGAFRYRLTFALTDDYRNIQRVVETSALEWTVSDTFGDSTVAQSYYYVVQACGVRAGETTAVCGQVTSTPPSFRKRSPSVDLTAPQAEARPAGPAMRTAGLALEWQSFADALRNKTTQAPTSEAAYYRLQVTTSGDPGFAAPVEDVKVDQTRWTSPDVTYPEGTLLWRVQAVDSDKHALPWSTVRKVVVDRTAPTAVVAPRPAVAVNGRVTVGFSEPVTGVDATTLSLSAPAALQLVEDKGAVLVPQRFLAVGGAYTVTLTDGIKDLSQNPLAAASAQLRVPTLADDGSAGITYAGTWRAMRASSANGGGYRASIPTTRARTAATVRVAGRGVVIGGCLGPANGIAEVWVDGVKRATLDTYRSYSGCGAVLARISGLSAGEHQVQLRGTGLKRAASKGTAVALDAVRAVA